MRVESKMPFPYGNAICYSGFRAGQHPDGEHPSYEQIKEDLLLLQGHWKYLRLYDCDQHAQTVIEVIQKEQLDFQLMLGAYIAAEVNNPNCPWGGGIYKKMQLRTNIKKNSKRIDLLIEWANRYPDIICSLSAGNEACVDWTDHLVPVESVIEYVKRIQRQTKQPVTFCENYVPWKDKLQPLAEEVDFISIHTYPVWEYKSIHEALHYTKENYYSIASLYPDKPIVITEAGWTTASNGHGIEKANASEALQKIYCDELMEWISKENIITFLFEAFDESWKGSPDPLEPEKHWGYFKEDRSPKLVARAISSS
ncbi:MAG: glycosyl hydrolase family 17 protein [Saprospiraceae bacterium]|nr:glycosyl hydrolase family 17 protein [Saprospiraceae bacterium]